MQPARPTPCPLLAVDVRSEHGVVVIALRGEADLSTEDLLAAGIAVAEADPARLLVLDLTELSFASGHAIGLLAEAAHRAGRAGTEVAVVGLTRPGSLMWQLTDPPLPVEYPTVERAVAAMVTPPSGTFDQADIDADFAAFETELEQLQRRSR